MALGLICHDFAHQSHCVPYGHFASTRNFTIGQPNQWILCFCCGWYWFGPVTGKKLSDHGAGSYLWESQWKHVERSVHGAGLENHATSGMSIFSWIVARLESRILVGSSKAKTVSNCFVLTSPEACPIPVTVAVTQMCHLPHHTAGELHPSLSQHGLTPALGLPDLTQPCSVTNLVCAVTHLTSITC